MDPDDRHTALLHACQHDTPAAVEQLLEAGGNPAYELRHSDNTALKAAARNPQHALAITRLLVTRLGARAADEIDNNGDPYGDDAGSDRETPLAIAIQTGNTALAAFLLEQGANPQPRHGLDYLSQALHAGHTELVALLRRHGVPPEPALTAHESYFRQHRLAEHLPDLDLPPLHYQPLPPTYRTRIELRPLPRAEVDMGSIFIAARVWEGAGYRGVLNFDEDSYAYGCLQFDLIPDGDGDLTRLFIHKVDLGRRMRWPHVAFAEGRAIVRYWWDAQRGAELLIEPATPQLCDALLFELPPRKPRKPLKRGG